MDIFHFYLEIKYDVMVTEDFTVQNFFDEKNYHPLSYPISLKSKLEEDKSVDRTIQIFQYMQFIIEIFKLILKKKSEYCDKVEIKIALFHDIKKSGIDIIDSICMEAKKCGGYKRILNKHGFLEKTKFREREMIKLTNRLKEYFMLYDIEYKEDYITENIKYLNKIKELEIMMENWEYKYQQLIKKCDIIEVIFLLKWILLDDVITDNLVITIYPWDISYDEYL